MVRSQDEILATITTADWNRGMRYDMEDVEVLRRSLSGQMRVDKMTNEVTAR